MNLRTTEGVMRNAAICASAWFLLVSLGTAQTSLSPLAREFVKVDAAFVALKQVRVIDGTGAATLLVQPLAIFLRALSTIRGEYPPAISIRG
jgi:hypothetical protein